MPSLATYYRRNVQALPEPIEVAWLRSYEAEQGRPLRVLHVGNIANNAYLNAKFLRSVGVEAHVLCYDYYHVMATPEWEDVELLSGHGDDFAPQFSPHDLRGYRRPAWFVNSPLISSAARIAALWGEHLPWWRRGASYATTHLVELTGRFLGHGAARALQFLLVDRTALLYRIWGLLRARYGADSRTLNFIGANARRAAGLQRRLVHWLTSLSFGRQGRIKALLRPEGTIDVDRLLGAYAAAFPLRPDRLAELDIMPYTFAAKCFRDIFRHYDIVQCYATDPIQALLADKRPYVAFEHGTLRDFTMGDVPLHRLTALGYRQADHTFITNGDCLDYARRLGIEDYSPIIHPIDVAQHRRSYGNAIPQLRGEIGADVVLFCPLRHDWSVKGTDVHLRALPLIKARVRGTVKLVLIRWGMQVADSEALLDDLGCAADVIWRGSMCRITMIKHIRAADVVLDQIALPHFGATAPQSIAAGTPVISSYEPASTRWIIPEPAPILPAFSPDEVADAVIRALDPDWRADYKRRAQAWTDTYHHPNNVIRGHLSVYRKVLEHDRARNRAQAPL